MTAITTTAIRRSGGRTPTWDVTVTREDGEARTYRVMAVDEEGAIKEALDLWRYSFDVGQFLAEPALSEEPPIKALEP